MKLLISKLLLAVLLLPATTVFSQDDILRKPMLLVNYKGTFKGQYFGGYLTSAVNDQVKLDAPSDIKINVYYSFDKRGVVEATVKSDQMRDPIYLAIKKAIDKAPRFAPALTTDDMYVSFADSLSIGVKTVKLKEGGVEYVVATKPLAKSDSMEQNGDMSIRLIAPQMPKFEGGDLLTFRRWVMSNVRYPQAEVAAGHQGRVVVVFILEKDGSIRQDFDIVQTPSLAFAEEVIRVLRQSPKWEPGYKDGEPVRVKYTLPIEFKLPEKRK